MGPTAAANAVDAVNALNKGVEFRADVLCCVTQAALEQDFVDPASLISRRCCNCSSTSLDINNSINHCCTAGGVW